MKNWQSIVQDLLNSGLSRQDISDRCECSTSMIEKIRSGSRGKNLSYRIAAPLMKMHTEAKRLGQIKSLR